MDTVLFFQRLNSSAARRRLEGLGMFAHEVGWNIQCQSELVTESELQELIDFWRPIGTVLSTNDRHTEYNTDLFSPENTVLQDCYPPKGLERYAMVTTDSAAATEIALRELVGRKCAVYGFIPWPIKYLWSENRRLHFLRLTEKYGLNAKVFNSTNTWPNVAALQKELAAWLGSLPRPMGILAANDIVGANVLTACHVAGISVPFECQVVGFDDDEAICEGVSPTLSSVRLDFRTAGYRAGELLHKLISGQLSGKPLVSVPPLGFMRRGSSRLFLQTDRHALKASEMILAKACEGLRAKDVLSVFPCSRRLAEMRFRKATGRSVLEEIRAVRIKKAKRLLADRRCELSVIANMCGYDSDTTFRRVFREETGMTMREWRRMHAAG